LLTLENQFGILLMHTEKRVQKHKTIYQKKAKIDKNSKKIKFIVDFRKSIWYITNAQRKKSAKMIFEN